MLSDIARLGKAVPRDIPRGAPLYRRSFALHLHHHRRHLWENGPNI